jgi:hypothetical protein
MGDRFPQNFVNSGNNGRKNPNIFLQVHGKRARKETTGPPSL